MNNGLRFDYEGLPTETRIVMNRAIDIYAIIKDRIIARDIYASYEHVKNYTFSSIDKRIMAIYLACFISGTSVSDILKNYDDIKAEDIMTFMQLQANEIKPYEGDYGAFYKSHFMMDIMNFVSSRCSEVVRRLSPEVLFLLLQYNHAGLVLEAFMNTLRCPPILWDDHSTFTTVRTVVLASGDLVENDLDVSSRHVAVCQTQRKNSVPVSRDSSQTLSSNVDVFSDGVWKILDDVQSKFIGQERACEDLFYSIINNQRMIASGGYADGNRSTIFLDGPKGTGKTAIIHSITDALGIPFVKSSITSYSAEGYKGGDITDVLFRLYEKANRNIELAQTGIVVFDEFDKIALSGDRDLVMKEAVQNQLLDFMGGGKYMVAGIEFDTSKLTFICAGALTSLRDKKAQKKNLIGFGDRNTEEETTSYSLTPKDLEEYGLIPEVVSRLNTYLHTEDYSQEKLLRILKESTISPMLGFKKWVESNGKELSIEVGTYETLAEIAYEMDNGARSLQTVMNTLRTHYMREVLRGKDKSVVLNSEIAEKVCGEVFVRKVRM